MVENLIPGIEQTAQCQINSFAHAYRGQNLAQGVVLHVKKISHILANRAAQSLQTIVAGIGCVSLFQRGNGGLSPKAVRKHTVYAHFQLGKISQVRLYYAFGAVYP